MKLGKLVDPQFQTILKKLAAQELPLRTAFSLRGVIKRVNEELAKYDEVRTEALKRYGNKTEDGELTKNEQGNVDLSEDNMALFISELNVLLATEVEIGSIKVADLGDKLNLSTNDLITLDDLVI